MYTTMVTELTTQTFPSTIAKGATIVDFWAPWCGPCRMMAPIFEEVSKEFPKVTFAKINVDDANDIAASNDVMSIPTLILYKDGKEVTRLTGALPKEELVDALKSVFS
jgi:thioredoxin 1